VESALWPDAGQRTSTSSIAIFRVVNINATITLPVWGSIDHLLHHSGHPLHFSRSRCEEGYDIDMEKTGLRSPSHLWIWIASVWLGFGMIDAAQVVFIMREQGMHHVWIKLFVVTVLFWLPWALATAPVINLGRRFPPLRLKPLATWPVHLAVCSLIAVLFTAWTTWLERFFDIYAGSSNPGTFTQLWFQKFLSGILSSLFLYAAILTISYIVESRARLAYQQTETARLNEQLSKAQLDALRSQIEPHFLFNTLNAVSGLVRAGEDDAAVTMIAGLSDFLRHTLDGSALQQVPLEEEMEFTQKYLNIQKVRFAARLQISVDVPAELNRAQVPTLILQPMVENAIKHGIAKRAQGGAIHIAAFRADGMLILTVFNEGPRLSSDSESTRSGIGIINVQTRLQALYGDAFKFSMRNGELGGVEASVSLPFVLTPPALGAI